MSLKKERGWVFIPFEQIPFDLISRKEEGLPVLFRKIKLRYPTQKVEFLSLRVIAQLFSFDGQPKESIHTRLQAYDS